MSNTRKPRKPNTLDFDALRKKKQGVVGQVPPVKIGGTTYTLRATLPLSVTEKFAEGAKVDENGDTKVLLADMQMILRELFGDDQWAEISRHIDITDVPDLFNMVFDAYGESVGESSPSGQS